MSRRGRGAGALGALLVWAAACSTGSGEGRSTSTPTPSSTTASDPASVTGPPPGSSPRRADPRWAAALAAGDDELAAAALAGQLGHVPLGEALADEDAVRALALRALPHADRPDLALGALGEALDAERGDQARVADAIERTLVGGRRDREVDTDAIGACAGALERRAQGPERGGLGPARARALARRVRQLAAPPAQAEGTEGAPQ